MHLIQHGGFVAEAPQEDNTAINIKFSFLKAASVDTCLRQSATDDTGTYFPADRSVLKGQWLSKYEEK